MTKPLTVVARMQAKSGREDLLRQALASLCPLTRSEEGCLQYDLHESSDQPGLFLFYENWASKTALDRHLATPHIAAVMARAPELLAGPVEITLWTRRDC